MKDIVSIALSVAMIVGIIYWCSNVATSLHEISKHLKRIADQNKQG